MVASFNYTPSFAAGRTNQSIANTVLNGRGAPTAKTGINGDFYIDTLTFNIYGPKVKNRWPAPINLRGPAGSDGRDGDKGSSSTGAEGARGPKGDAGPQGVKGDKGEKGDKGDPGEKGAQGLIGLTGATGPTGAKGETGATGSAGLKGDKGDAGIAGAVGATGATGATGPAGAKGDTGTAGLNGTNGTNGLPGAKGDKGDPGNTGAQGIQGPAGPSNVKVGSIQFPNPLQGNAQVGQTSSAFGNFEAGKSYIVDILIWGISSSNAHSLKLSISSSDNSVQPISHWFTSLGNTYRDNSVASEYSFMGRVALDGSLANAAFNLIVNVTTGGPIIAGEAVTLSGGFSGQLVGSVSSVNN